MNTGIVSKNAKHALKLVKNVCRRAKIILRNVAMMHASNHVKRLLKRVNAALKHAKTVLSSVKKRAKNVSDPVMSVSRHVRHVLKHVIGVYTIPAARNAFRVIMSETSHDLLYQGHLLLTNKRTLLLVQRPSYIRAVGHNPYGAQKLQYVPV
jgi:hypothetical protein